MESPKLFRYANIGYQQYLVNHQMIEKWMLWFESLRLGMRNNMSIAEPVIRDTHIISFDISSARQSDARELYSHLLTVFMPKNAAS